jgi:hypothetical protein
MRKRPRRQHALGERSASVVACSREVEIWDVVPQPKRTPPQQRLESGPEFERGISHDAWRHTEQCCVGFKV